MGLKMTEQRFKIYTVELLVTINYDDDKTLFNLYDACDILNKLNDENQKLKQEIKEKNVEDSQMSQKRYELRYRPNTYIWDNLENKELFAWAEDDDPQVIVDELNKLS